MKRVLLTGASGFIGRHSLPFLLERGYDVHAVSSQPCVEDFAGVTWHQADLLEPAALEPLLARIRPTHLLHLAWYTEPGAYWQSAENLRWLEASLRLLQLFHRHGGERIVTAGTCAEYDWQHGLCSEKETPLIPTTLYGVTKLALNDVTRVYSQSSALSSAWGRVFFLFGPHESPRRFVASIISSLLSGREARCSHGRQIRDFLFVKDVASAFVALLDSEVTGSVNLASGNPVSLASVAETTAGMLGHPELLRLGALQPSAGEPSVLVGDSGRLTHQVGWRPSYSLEQGLNETIRWWKQALHA